jgi:SagB-type dehydrogenase family enzyme
VFVGSAPFTYILTAIPYRTEWRYRRFSPKLVLLDAGHVLQNVYIACEGVDLGTCAIDAFSDKSMNEVMGLDGKKEFVVYLAPVGIPKK